MILPAPGSPARLRPRRRPWLLPAGLGLALALAVGAAWWRAAGAPATPVTAPGAAATEPPAGGGTPFPWGLAAGVGDAPAAAPPPPAAALGSTGRFGEALTTGNLQPPPRPVWQMLRGYTGPSAAGVETDLALLAALSYCDVSSMVPQHLWEARSQGSAPPEAIQAMEQRHAEATPLCARLAESDYRVRVDILRHHARAGNADAQLHFEHVGPAGRWSSVGRATLPLDEGTQAAWLQEVLGYTRQALAQQTWRAASSLAWIYDPGPQVPNEPPYAAVRDAVEGQAWRLVMAEFAPTEQLARNFVALARHEGKRLTPEQRALAEERFQALLPQVRASVGAARETPGAAPPPALASVPRPSPSPFAAQ